ncbi:MAG TPA: NAD/NADP octopine/nopaline dehydrogenase family protein [Candidatus Baltobacteraceae bacterium]|nr:NAD/NADP octopine/nopaline dehydrogenase family protein [Candidatus Baltobacteraceae bacterium]
MESSLRVIAICGGGNAGHALAVAVSARFDGEVRWLTGAPEKAELLRRGVFSEDGLIATGLMSGRAHRIAAISSDAAQIIPDADLVLMAVPAFAHAGVLKRIAPHLKSTAIIGALPARGGFEFEASALLSGIEPQGERIIFALQTLPWSTRVQEPGRVVHVGAVKAGALMAALPARRAPGIAALLERVLGTQVIPTNTFLNMTLGNPGQIIHPGLMYGLFRKWTGRRYSQDEIPFFYRDTTDENGAFVEQLSADVCSIAASIESGSAGALNLSGVLTVHDWLRVSYPTQTADQRTVASCFRTGPLQARKAPMTEIAPDTFVPNFAYRYLSEDVPYGLVVTKALAQIAGVGTPAIDAVLRWAQRRLGASYITGRALDARGTANLPIPQSCGIRTLDELVAWYAPMRAVTGTVDTARQVAS